MKKEKILKDEQGNDIVSPHLSDNPSEEGEVKVCEHMLSSANIKCLSHQYKKGGSWLLAKCQPFSFYYRKEHLI